MKSDRSRAGFTLIEVLAVILLTSVIFGVAINGYIDLSRGTQRASDTTRDIRRATAILDHVARDFENVVLLRTPPEMDPLEHPWIFLGESRRSDVGADHLKFVTRGRQPQIDAVHESDLEMVAYSLRRAADDDSFELMRWSSPRLPEGLDRDIPSDESEGAMLLADGLAHFGVRFVTEDGSIVDHWDSSQLLDSSELPIAVDIEVAFYDPDWDPGVDPDAVLPNYIRRVVLPLRPLDLAELLDPNSLVNGGAGGEGANLDDEEIATTGGDERTPCGQTPCAGMRACTVIGCIQKEGLFGHSIDTMFEDVMQRNQSFCTWRQSHSVQLRWLIDNPACR